MTDQFEPDELDIHIERGIWFCAYKGTQIPKWNQGVVGGRGEFFNINNEFFVKTAFAYDTDSQCKTEVYQYGKIEDEDRRYFTEMLGCSNFNTNIHWTCWKFIELKKFSWDDPFFDRCSRTVDRLCEKYKIADVKNYPNGNWWIVNSEPIIVDLGIVDSCETRRSP